jgi:hypothetical protein
MRARNREPSGAVPFRANENRCHAARRKADDGGGHGDGLSPLKTQKGAAHWRATPV